MEQPQHYWFGITYTFVCSRCHKVNSEKAGCSSTTNDSSKINLSLSKQKLCCQHCHFQIADGVVVDARIKSGTPESLRKEGFPFPADN
jgi:hypothetical protein